MKTRIGILSKDEILYSKLRLLLHKSHDTVLISDPEDAGDFSLVLLDLDTYGARIPGAITMSRTDACDLTIPFLHEDAISLIEERSRTAGEYISLMKDGRNVSLFGEAVRLTELEYKLLEALLLADGYVSREKLLNTVWGEGFDPGIVNVYVHYLRTKLERDGRRIILSSRKEGYSIDEKYRRKV